VIDADKELAKLAASAGKSAGRKTEKIAKSEKTETEKTEKLPRPAGFLRLHLVRSGICAPKDQKATLVGLGLRRLGQRVIRPDAPDIRGMVHKVRHLVEIENEKS
jgi:large subunit ribosomal protein L30